MLVSGSGTILQAIIETGIDVALVCADRPCRGLEVAESAGVDALLLDRAAYGGFSASFDREAYSVDLASLLDAYRVDLVAMAGFGTIVTGAFHRRFPGRVLNTHPSLLPAFKGWHAVNQALEAAVSETGCTVHLATEVLDDGPILAQARVPVERTDTEDVLHERIKTVERELYPLVISRVMASLAAGQEPVAVVGTLEENR